MTILHSSPSEPHFKPLVREHYKPTPVQDQGDTFIDSNIPLLQEAQALVSYLTGTVNGWNVEQALEKKCLALQCS